MRLRQLYGGIPCLCVAMGSAASHCELNQTTCRKRPGDPMLSARIELRGEELFCAETGEGGASTARRLPPDALAGLRAWAERYDAAVRSGALPPLVEIGRDIAAF